MNPDERRRNLLHTLWVSWCEDNSATTNADECEWPAEAFLRWAAHELRVEVLAFYGDARQCALLHELAPHVQETNWPAPPPDNEHPTEPSNKRPSETAPPLDDAAEDLLGAAVAMGGLLGLVRPPFLQMREVSAERPDLVQRGKLAAGSTLELGYQPHTHVAVTWLAGSWTPFSLETREDIVVRSVSVRGDERLAQPIALIHLIGRQNEGLLGLPAAGSGDAIRIKLENTSNTDLDVELRLHGVEPVKESETA